MSKSQTFKIVDVGSSLENTPRPHYLRGNAHVSSNESTYSLKSKVCFSVENPSVGDRSSGKYLNSAHVNAGDALFAFWNGAHILSEHLGYQNRTLRKNISIDLGNTYLLPETEYDLTITLKPEKRLKRSKNGWIKGDLEGEISSDGERIISVSASYCAEPKDKKR